MFIVRAAESIPAARPGVTMLLQLGYDLNNVFASAHSFCTFAIPIRHAMETAS